MNNWIVLSFLYACFISLTEVSKKKATKKSSIYEILAFFTITAFLISCFISKDALKIDYVYLPAIFIKSLIIVVTWILALKALEGLQIGIYGMLKISRIIFTILLSYIFLGEKITIITILGMLLIISGLVLVNINTDRNKEKNNSYKLILLFLISCFGSSVTSIIDKELLHHMSSGQMQFWFLLFLSILYTIILLFKEKKFDYKKVISNYWIVLCGIFLVVGDRFYFMAVHNPSSIVMVMTMIKQLSIIFSIILGRFIFKEKEIWKKLLYSILIICGVAIIIIF